jgi:putrescine transport system substrate-binding protein
VFGAGLNASWASTGLVPGDKGASSTQAPSGLRTEMRRLVSLGLCALISLVAFAALVVSGRAEERVVNVYNWTDYIDPAAITRFEQETGIKVRYDVYDSLETLEGKLLAGHSGYDVVVPTAEPTFSRLIRVGALAEIDRAAVPNWANLDADMMRKVAAADPGNRHGAIYLWGTTGLGLNPADVAAALPKAREDSWDLLLKPENARKLASCGIFMMDSATDVVPSVLHYLGKSPDSTNPADLEAVERALMAIRPFIRTFASGGALEALATGQACLALDYSGDVAQASARAREAGRGVAVRYVVPAEGGQLAFDMLAIPADAPHKDAALAFINFLLRPDVMAGITNATRYPNAVPASRPMIRPELLADPAVYPTQAEAARLFTVGPVPPTAQRQRTRMWARFKAGQ